ncbi:MAG: DUF4249 domain-containing protein [Bacteroidetes bacterium]|nr:DUF4249 domain-containing protein [Bacteroidota bacterium]
MELHLQHIQSTTKAILSFCFVILFFVFSSCEKDISVKLPDVEEKLMVEGFIENDMPATVFLTKNTPYFATFTNVGVEDYAVSNAIITINDGIVTDTLFEFLPFAPGFYVSHILGEIGKTYQLSVSSGGKNVTATTTIQQPVPIINIRFQKNSTTNKGTVWTKILDPTTKQYYRMLHKETEFALYDSPPTSVYKDDSFNGQEFEFGDFFEDLGDSSYIKICVIDKAAHDFINNFEIDARNRGNPFANPITIKGNINGGLGIWCGYGASYASIKNE